MKRCEELVAVHKTEVPLCCIVFLGIEIDTVRGWMARTGRYCMKRELLSLNSQLQHTCCVVRPGRTFLSRVKGTTTEQELLV